MRIFGAASFGCLDYQISVHGISPLPHEVQVIQDFPTLSSLCKPNHHRNHYILVCLYANELVNQSVPSSLYHVMMPIVLEDLLPGFHLDWPQVSVQGQS